MLTTILEQQGFSSLEAKVYLATLELGQAPASQIARTIETDRTTVYSCLQTLIKKKIILTIVKNKLTYFSAVSPQKLVADAQSKVNALMDNLPELLTLSSAFWDKPSVQYYEGLEGIKLLFEDILSYADSTIQYFAAPSQLMHPSVRRRINTVFLPTRKKRKIFSQVVMPIAEKGQTGYDFLFNTPQQYAEIRFVPLSSFSIKDGLYMYGGDKIAIIIYNNEDMRGFIIKSPSLHTTLFSLFELIWEHHTEKM